MNEQQLRDLLRRTAAGYDVPPYPPPRARARGGRGAAWRWLVPVAAAVAVVAVLLVVPQWLTAEAPPATAPSPSTEPAPSRTGEPAPRDCPLRPVRELPSGAEPGVPREEGAGRFVWGSGDDQVIVLVEQAALEVLGEDSFAGVADFPDSQSVVVDGVRRAVLPIGDFGVGSVAVLYVVDGCRYAVYLPDGTGEEQSLSYAARF